MYTCGNNFLILDTIQASKPERRAKCAGSYNWALSNSQNILNVNLLTRNDYNFPNYPHKSHRKHFLSSGFRRTKPTTAWGHGRPGSGNRKEGAGWDQQSGGRNYNHSPTIISREARDETKFCFEDNTPLSCPSSINKNLTRLRKSWHPPVCVQIVISGQFLPAHTILKSDTRHDTALGWGYLPSCLLGGNFPC